MIKALVTNLHQH